MLGSQRRTRGEFVAAFRVMVSRVPSILAGCRRSVVGSVLMVLEAEQDCGCGCGCEPCDLPGTAAGLAYSRGTACPRQMRLRVGRHRRSRGASKVPVARVHSRFEALLVGYALQQLDERAAFGVVQRGGDVVLMVYGDLSDVGQGLRSSFGEVQGVVTPVRGAAPAFYEAAFLEPVDQRDDRARYDAELICQCLLTAPRFEGHEPHDPALGWSEIEPRDPLGEQAGGMCAKLSEQECGTRGRRSGPRSLTVRWARFLHSSYSTTVIRFVA